jgi:hypothetical protein
MSPDPSHCLYLFPFCFFDGQVQPGAVSVLPEGTPGQLQPEAARLPRPQHEVRPVPQEGKGGQGRADPLRQGRAGHVHAQLGTSPERGVTHSPPHPPTPPLNR